VNRAAFLDAGSEHSVAGARRNAISAPSLNAQHNPGKINISFSTERGYAYSLETKTNAGDAWAFAGEVSGNGGIRSFVEEAQTSRRFYRVRRN
jgi:hypothetical protein